MHKWLYGFLISWGLLASYYALQHEDVKWVTSFLNGKKEVAVISNPEKALPFIRQSLKDYYDYGETSSAAKKVGLLKGNFSNKAFTDLSSVYERELSLFESKNGIRKINILRVEWNKDSDTYTVFSKIHQEIPGELENTHQTKLEIVLEKRLSNSAPYKISRLNEKILSSLLSSDEKRRVSVESELASRVILPCVPKFITQIYGKKDDSIKVTQEGEKTIFISKGEIASETKYKAVCAKKHFEISLVSDESKTLYQELSMSDGRNNAVKLSVDEKLFKDVERELGIKIKTTK